MAWEHLLKRQGQLASVFFGKSMTRWLAAKAAAKANNYDPKQFASDVVSTWAEALDFWWGPWSYGDPMLPVLFVQNSAGLVELDHDVVKANVSFTDCGQVGGTKVIPAMSGGVSNIQFDVVDGSTLTVTGITTVPNQPGLYLGLAFDGTVPLASVLVKL